jgi:hypothetical protein
MANIQEIMAAGTPAALASMLGSSQLQVVAAGGVDQGSATPLTVNFALLESAASGAGVCLGWASGGAVTALLNTGPQDCLIWPAENDALNGLAADQPMALAAGSLFLGVPSVDEWLAVISPADGGIQDAPLDGQTYGRQGGVWVPIPPPGTPPPAVSIGAGGTTNVSPGIGRAFVNAAAPVTLVLPPNDLLVMDRGGSAGLYPITCNAPAGATINGNPSFVLVNNWASVRFIYDGTNFGIG